jgi:hypothetical protein
MAMTMAPPGRVQRMLLALLASCDPCSGPAQPYDRLAHEAAERLQSGGCQPADLFVLFPEEADASRVLQFTAVAMDWWATDR